MRPLRRWEIYAVDEYDRPLDTLPGVRNPRFWTRRGAERDARYLNHYARLLRYRFRYTVRPTKGSTVHSTTPEPAQLPEGPVADAIDDFLETPDALGERRERPFVPDPRPSAK